MNAEFPDSELALTDAAHDAIEAQSWRSLILAGYLPYWSWRSRRFCWELTPTYKTAWRLGPLLLEHDTDYGIDHRSGWSCSWGGSYTCELEPNLLTALGSLWKVWGWE